MAGLGTDLVSDARVAIHLALTAIMAWLAIVLILPGDTFFGNRSFTLMARMASEDHWAMVFWVTASVGLTGLTTRSAILRLTSVLALATMHGVFALLLFCANPVSSGTGTYMIVAGLGYYLSWRRSREGV